MCLIGVSDCSELMVLDGFWHEYRSDLVAETPAAAEIEPLQH
jgi:hypothetical protein